LNRVLHDNYDLSLNHDKTIIFDDILVGANRASDIAIRNSSVIRRLKEQNIADIMTGKDLREYLLATYEIQKNHPQNRPAISILNILNETIATVNVKNLHISDIEYATVVLRRLIMKREDVTPQAILLLDQLLSLLPASKRQYAIKNIYKVFLNESDRTYQEIWLYRLCIHQESKMIGTLFSDTNNPFIKATISPNDDHVNYFETPRDIICDEDLDQLKKFRLVNHDLLYSLYDKPISKAEVSPFKY
jgi:hypothetical protein